MSIIQLDKHLKDSLREKEAVGDEKKVLLFVYDRYYVFKGFENDYPSANFLGVGWLNDWEWHVQCSGVLTLMLVTTTQLTIHQGKPNIRPIYQHQSGFIREKAGERGTFGHIFAIAPSDVELFRRSYSGKRIKLTEKAHIGCEFWTRDHQVPIITFWDPYDTTSRTNIVYSMDQSEETIKWTHGLLSLQAIGCPAWYIQKVFDYIRGMDPLPETVAGIYVGLGERKPSERCLAGTSPLEEMLLRRPQEEFLASNAISSSAGGLGVLNGVKGKDSRVTKAPNMKNVKRPQPVKLPALKGAKAEARKGKRATGGTDTI